MLKANSVKYLAFLIAFQCHGQVDPYSLEKLKQMTLTELLDLQVITPSRVEQKLIDAPANITVITQNQIRNRGYQNLVELLQDLPGFDFSTYEDGGGEYPNHALNRGIGGDPGGPKLLILLDGIVQNHIAFNWSQLFGEEQIFQDLDRIEVLQGPVSAVYGANAFSGIIHFITKRRADIDHTDVSFSLGQHNTRSLSLFHQQKVAGLNINGAFKLYRSDGDMGIKRPDPGGYFHNNLWPTMSTEDYDPDGQYTTNVVNPNSGQQLPDGFNTTKDDWSVRGNVNYFAPAQVDSNSIGLVKSSLSLFIWNKHEGLASYVPAFEYQATLDSFRVHHSAQMFAADMDFRINTRWLSTTSSWYRQNRQLPDTGFQYTYRFPNLVKSYHSLNTQWGLEQQLKWQLDDNHLLLLGYRYIANDKMDQVVSLGEYQDGHDPVTTSSWQHATASDQPQLGLSSRVNVFQPKEQALYATYDGEFNQRLSYSAGIRLDNSDDYGSNTNPRLGLIYKVPNTLFERWNLKMLYGEAFREPSIFELTDEFRGNRVLQPEQIKTLEWISQLSWQGSSNALVESFSLNTSLFYADMANLITLVQSSDSESGSIYANAVAAKVRGFTLVFDAQFSTRLTFSMNYQFTEGNQNDHWRAINNSARNKWNLALNWLTLDERLNINLRANLLSARKVPASNGYFDNYAPGYNKLNLTMSWQSINWSSLKITPQLMVKNLLDEAYVGVGRQDGRSNAAQYDPVVNPNPEGFVPGYHPQPGRSVLFNLNMEF